MRKGQLVDFYVQRRYVAVLVTRENAAAARSSELVSVPVYDMSKMSPPWGFREWRMRWAHYLQLKYGWCWCSRSAQRFLRYRQGMPVRMSVTPAILSRVKISLLLKRLQRRHLSDRYAASCTTSGGLSPIRIPATPAKPAVVCCCPVRVGRM